MTGTCGWGTVFWMHPCLGLISFSWENLDGIELLLHSPSQEISSVCLVLCDALTVQIWTNIYSNLDRKAINKYHQSSTLWTDMFSAINYKMQNYRLFLWAVMRHELFKQKLVNLNNKECQKIIPTYYNKEDLMNKSSPSSKVSSIYKNNWIFWI